MSRRSKDWNEGLALDLRNKDFARAFIEACLAEGLSLQEVMGKVIRAYGIKEFAKKSGLQGPNILRTINPKHNPTVVSLNRLLKPFSLTLSIAALITRSRTNRLAA